MRLVELMGGSILVDSRKGQGTTFTILLPSMEANDAETLEQAANDPVVERARILVVEDNLETRTVIRKVLQNDYDLVFACDSKEALEKAAAAKFDLVILDINLGNGPDGGETLAALRQRPEYLDTPIVACTAHSLPGDKERFLAQGFDAYLDKPFRKAAMIDLVGSLVAWERTA
ncbi:hypothetical protein BH23BAC4_BH23BAC4_09060 [soil metagenome]